MPSPLLKLPSYLSVDIYYRYAVTHTHTHICAVTYIFEDLNYSKKRKNTGTF